MKGEGSYREMMETGRAWGAVIRRIVSLIIYTEWATHKQGVALKKNREDKTSVIKYKILGRVLDRRWRERESERERESMKQACVKKKYKIHT